jgi:dTDP-4-dehydrorhamnose reductase
LHVEQKILVASWSVGRMVEQGRPGPAVLVTGGRGQLGSDLARAATGALRAPGSAELDITDPTAVGAAVRELAEQARALGVPAVAVNAAAYTAVDAAESDPDRAELVNGVAAGRLAAACAEHDVPLLHVSTDYVFAGDATEPYRPDHPTGPTSVYGRSKLAGERAVLAAHPRAWVVRTAWVYGVTGGNFVKTMIRLSDERETLSVVDDQRGSPTWSADLAAGLLDLAAAVTGGPGPRQRVLHATNAGETTWFGLARAVFAELGADPERVRPCATTEFPRPAPRPAYSVLSTVEWKAAGLAPLPPWRTALHEFFLARKENG